MARSSHETNHLINGKSKRSRKSENSSTEDNKSIFKCSKCPKLGRRSCSQSACLKCCTDDRCEGHREQRESAKEKDLIIEGKHYINRMAAHERARAIPPGKFHESSIKYTRETLTIWSLEQYMANPKWRDDAVRRSKRKAELLAKDRLNENLKKQIETKKKRSKESEESVTVTNCQSMKKVGQNRSQRFKAIMDNLYVKSLASDA